jgi:hypothetical protein
VPVLSALFGNLAVAAITLAILGWNSAGAHAAARNTARFSALFCAAALASPAVFRIFHRDRESQLILAFVAAHVVHFLTVAALLVTFERAHIAERAAQSVAVIAVGFSLTLGLGLAATAVRPAAKAIRSITLYAASLIFFLAFFHHNVRPLRAIAVIIAVALVLRLTNNLTFWTARAQSS